MTACERITVARVEGELEAQQAESSDVDYVLENHGSVWLLRAISDGVESWIEDFVSYETTFGDAIVVEPRYIGSIAEGLGYAGYVGVIR